MIEGREALTALLGPVGEFQNIQKGHETRAYLDLILSDGVPIVNLRNRHRVRGLYWQPETKRLFRVDEPPSRTYWDYETTDIWASRLAIQIWQLKSSPKEDPKNKTLVAKKLSGSDIELPLNGSVYPEPAAVAIQVSGTEKILLPWSSISNVHFDSEGAQPTLIQQSGDQFKILPLHVLTRDSVHPDFWRGSINVNESKEKNKLVSRPPDIAAMRSDASFCQFLLNVLPPNGKHK